VVAAAETAWTIRDRYADALPPATGSRTRRSSVISATASAHLPSPRLTCSSWPLGPSAD